MKEAEIERWQREVLARALEPKGAHLQEDELPGGGLSLLSADTDRTQAYVFQTARLTEIRGASMRLDELNRDGLLEVLDKRLKNRSISRAFIDDDPPGVLIFNGGGSLLALVPTDLAEAIVEDIEILYPAETGAATITAIAQPVSTRALHGKTPSELELEHVQIIQGRLSGADKARFAHAYGLAPERPVDESTFVKVMGLRRIMAQQTLLLRQRKQAKERSPLFEATPYARTCRSCGRRPAVDALPLFEDETPRYLCQLCLDNHHKGRNERSHWLDQFEEATGVETERAEDLSRIGAASAKEGYVGFIYADGNSIGRLLESSPALLDYRRRSRTLSEAMEAAVYKALSENLNQGGRAHPFEIITIGGDDALLIVPADAALPIAVSICRRFQQELQDALNEEFGATMSAGVVLAQDSNPIYFLSDLARQLLKNAKKNQIGNETEPRIDFIVLKSQSTVATDLSDVRSSPALLVQSELDKQRCLLTGRPYTLSELALLLDSTAQLKGIGFSPGQLHGLRREFQRGRRAGLLYYLYQRAKLEKDSVERATLSQIERSWGLEEAHEPVPWRNLGRAADGYKEYDTPFLDMLELLEFVSR